MFHFNREPRVPKAEQDPLMEKIAEAEMRLAHKVSIALNRLESADVDRARRNAKEDQTAYDDSKRLNDIRNAYEVFKLKCHALGVAALVAALTAIILGLTKYPDSKELAEQITALGVVGGGFGYYAVLIWRMLTERGVAAEVETIKNRYE